MVAMTEEKVSIMRGARWLAGLLVAATLLAAGGAARAEFRREVGAVPLVVAQLPPDQRRQMRQEMREHWQQIQPPEDRLRLRDERRERWQQMPPQDRQRWQQMSPEERQRLREEMRGRRDGAGSGYGPGPRGPGGGYRGGRP
jgi:hypothetical protein